MKKTILIFGVSSFLGSNLLEALKHEFRIVGTYFKTPVTIPGITCIPCDVLKKEYVSRITSFVNPDITIYAVGMSSLKECQLFPKKADALNFAGAVNCCTASERVSSKFVYISSAFVMSGLNPIYHEGEAPFAATVYGNTVSSAEFYIQRSSLNYLILRCSSLYGWGLNPTHPNWFESLQLNLAKNNPVIADDFVQTGFMDVQIMGKVLLESIKYNVTNRLFNVATKNTMTRFEFAKLYAAKFKRDVSLIQKGSGSFPVEPKNESSVAYKFHLSTANVEDSLSIQMPTIEDSLEFTHQRLLDY